MSSISTSSKIGMVAIGFKVLPFFLKFLKSAKVVKVGLAASSVAAYTVLLTWQFAVILIAMLFIHESGHIWAMKKCGMKTKGIYFIPLFGAAAVGEGEFPSRESEVFIALMGPLWGLMFSAGLGAMYFISGDAIFAAGAGWMAMINLFNLIPINPLDGGRVFKSIAFSLTSWMGFAFMIFGAIACVFLAYKLSIGLFSFLLMISIMEFMSEFLMYRSTLKRGRKIRQGLISEGFPEKIVYEEINRSIGKLLSKYLHKMNLKTIFKSLGYYFGLVFLLYWLMLKMNNVPEASAAMEFLKG